MFRKLVCIIPFILLMGINQVSAEVLGFFETESGIRGVVTGKEGYGALEIALSTGNVIISTVSLKNCQWQLQGNKVSSLRASKKIQGKNIRVVVENGSFYIPIFGAKFVNKKFANVYFENSDTLRIKKINLPIEGGEIKGFKVLENKIDLLVYNQKTFVEKSEDGDYLYGISRDGENMMVKVNQNKAEIARKLNSNDADIFWSDGEKLYCINGITLKLEEVVEEK